VKDALQILTRFMMFKFEKARVDDKTLDEKIRHAQVKRRGRG
jgi:hypothetical protein